MQAANTRHGAEPKPFDNDAMKEVLGPARLFLR